MQNTDLRKKYLTQLNKQCNLQKSGKNVDKEVYIQKV